MSVNENQEFEAINQRTKERTVNVDEVRQNVADTYKAVKIRRKTKAITIMAVTLVVLVIALRGINGLEAIGWINGSFKAVLMCAAGCVAMFTQGYFWHEFKD
jgi:uncharacterized membrane protein